MRTRRTLALSVAIVLMRGAKTQDKTGSPPAQQKTASHSTCVPEPAARVSDPIELEERRCLDDPSGMSTVGMMDCEQRAYEAYDKRLNTVYAQVLRGVDPKSAGLIRQAQRAWLAWRKAEMAAYHGPWGADRGTMIGPELAATRVEALKSRIAQLRLYLPD